MRLSKDLRKIFDSVQHDVIMAVKTSDPAGYVAATDVIVYKPVTSLVVVIDRVLDSSFHLNPVYY